MNYRFFAVAFCVMAIVAGGSAVADETAGQGEPKACTVKPSEPGKPYTSLIIDASGFSLERTMSPKLRRTDGTEVWGTVKYDCDYLQENGVVAYARSVEEAKKSPRCGPNPLIVCAVDVQGSKFDTDPVVSEEDAKALAAENEKGKFFDRFNVIFVKGDGPTRTAKK